MFCPDLETAFKKQHECSKSPTRVARMSPPPRSSMHGKHNIGQKLWRRMNIEEKKEEKHVESGTCGCSGLFRLHFTTITPPLPKIARWPNTPRLPNSPTASVLSASAWTCSRDQIRFSEVSLAVFHHPTFSAANTVPAPVRLCLSLRQQPVFLATCDFPTSF